jgi:peptidoglycan/LPS O-acetylase OafA/YrhL
MQSPAAIKAALPSKSHYVILDGLRGVAALLVVAFHLFEVYADGNPERQIINHGYLAVDFFFMLSGFVVAYAYDDRWLAGMTQWDFYKRRLVRLQPMIIVGSVIGALLFGLQHSSIFPKVATTTPWQVILIMVIGFTMIPLPPSADIRGWNETFPLNGPAWSLFYEYVANILYAVGLRKLPNKALGGLVALGAVITIWLAVFEARGDLIGGWSLDAEGIRIGLTRVFFPFFAGILLMRLGKRIKVPGGFAVCSLLLIAALAMPRFGGAQAHWQNGIYEAACVILLFPLIVAIGAGEKDVDGPSVRIARFFGSLSYPLYITHYPLVYIYTGWVVDNKIPPVQGALVATGIYVLALVIAWTCLKVYDEPVRRWLANKLLKSNG